MSLNQMLQYVDNLGPEHLVEFKCFRYIIRNSEKKYNKQLIQSLSEFFFFKYFFTIFKKISSSCLQL